MIADDPVSVSRRRTSLLVSCCNLSVKVVVEPIKETLAEVHVTNWVYSLGEVDAARHLAIAMSPVMFNAFHVPLVDKNDNFLSLALVNHFEEIFITFINEYLLHLGEEEVARLDVPVH